MFMSEISDFGEAPMPSYLTIVGAMVPVHVIFIIVLLTIIIACVVFICAPDHNPYCSAALLSFFITALIAFMTPILFFTLNMMTLKIITQTLCFFWAHLFQYFVFIDCDSTRK